MESYSLVHAGATITPLQTPQVETDQMTALRGRENFFNIVLLASASFMHIKLIPYLTFCRIYNKFCRPVISPAIHSIVLPQHRYPLRIH
jgi:hypothetical protein